MIKIENFLSCTGCSACFSICSKNAITMSKNNEGFLYPQIDKTKCVECRLCEKICPVIQSEKNNTAFQKKFSYKKAFACIAKDEKIRVESSSGGVFTLLAEKVLKDRGVVFGAAFTDNFSVIHDWTNKKDEIEKFRGSKYVQSSIEDSFIKCRDFLEANKKVLFTGTPCQIAGLKSFLQKDYENLFCVDLICHGVPSPLLWQKYINTAKKTPLRGR